MDRSDGIFTLSEDNPEFKATMSAHEAGHATLGITLGARIEAVYAQLCERSPDGNFRVCYLTRFGAFRRAGLELEDEILITAGGAAGELLLNRTWDEKCVAVDRMQAAELGASNFSYCINEAIKLLRENIVLLTAIRDQIRMRLLNLKECKLTKRKTHIVLAKGEEIERLYRAIGFRVSSTNLKLADAGLKSNGATGT